jgi:hypothetical protein
MSLRTLVGRLRQHDWTAVAIELLIVVVGVFIGLQVSNWNEERKETARGDEYLRRLGVELREDSRELEKISAFWTRVGDYGGAAIAYAEDGALVNGSAWQTLLAYYQASQVWPYRKSDVTFQEIRSNGDLLLIRDPGLRERISRHYSAAAGSQVVEVLGLVPRYREDVRGMTPWKIQQYIWANCYASERADQVLKDCESPVSESEARAVLEHYRQSSALTDELRFWMVNVRNGLMLMAGIRTEVGRLADDVQRVLAH